MVRRLLLQAIHHPRGGGARGGERWCNRFYRRLGQDCCLYICETGMLLGLRGARMKVESTYAKEYSGKPPREKGSTCVQRFFSGKCGNNTHVFAAYRCLPGFSFLTAYCL